MKLLHTGRKGFSLIELLVVVAGLSVLGGGGFVTMSNVIITSRENKLESDAATINRAIDVYVANGGSFSGSESAGDILDKLQTVASATGAPSMMGMRRSMLDSRVDAEMQSSAEATSTQLRAVPQWYADRNMWYFQVGRPSEGVSAAGVKEFVFDEIQGSVVAVEETRDVTKEVASEGWIWGHEVVSESERPIGWSPFIGLQVATEQLFPGGYWTVGSSGVVPVSYVYREAGYKSRLALFSLEGMGSTNFNLDTGEGQRQFLLEALRRIIDQDRAHTIIDVSKDKAIANSTDVLRVVRDRPFTFRPGDTVAALLIPNTSFETARALLESVGTIPDGTNLLETLAKGQGIYNKDYVRDATGSRRDARQVFPLTSLIRSADSNNVQDNFPFYADQFASLGTGANAYAIEDIQGGGDNDYQDLIFQAGNLSAPEGSITNTIDPYTYYGSKLDRVGSGGGMTLREALIEAGIMGG